MQSPYYSSFFFTCITRRSAATMSYPVHLVVLGLEPATQICVIEIAASVVITIKFIWAIPAVFGKVTELRTWDALFVTVGVRWTIKVSFKRTHGKDSWKQTHGGVEIINDVISLFKLWARTFFSLTKIIPATQDLNESIEGEKWYFYGVFCGHEK